MIRLPKDIVADPRHDAIVRLLTDRVRPLRDSSQNAVPTLEMNDALAKELGRMLVFDQATQGLEAIVELLAKEQKGLDALNRKSPDQPQRERISRLLLVASDGSERFFHDCDSLMTKYASRMICCRIKLTGDELGARVLPKPRLVRAILIHDKKAVSRVLLGLC
jgi:hypothetical protein